jgi:SSS family solute:Na+ symporter
MIIIGWWSRRRAENREGFFVASRRGSLPLITGSLVSTAVGGSTTIGMAGLGFTLGLTGAWWLLVGSIGLLILGFLFAKKIRGAAVYTLPELVENQYGPRVALVASILIVIAWTGVVAGQIIAAGKILSIIGIWSTTSWMAVFSAVFITYTILGGQFSIIRTDFLQAAIIFAGIFAGFALTIPQVGGIGGLQASLPSTHFCFPTSPEFDWKMLASTLILVGSTYVVGPDIYTRLFCARDENVAKKSALLSAFLFVPLAFAITLIGMGARALYPNISPEQSFPYLISEVLPLTIGYLVLAALIAALMSSADTCLLSQSVILTQDVLGRFRPQLGERKIVWLTRLNALVLGFMALGLALVLKGVIASLLFAYTIFACGLVIPVIAGFYKERLKVNSKGAMAALIGGGTIGLLGKIPWLEIPVKEDFGLVGFAMSAFLLFVVSTITKHADHSGQIKNGEL